MSLEKNIERIAVALEVLANNAAIGIQRAYPDIAVGGNTQPAGDVTPPASSAEPQPTPDDGEDQLTPAQKGARTKARNKAAKAAGESEVPGPTPVNQQQQPAGPSSVGQPTSEPVPTNVEEMNALCQKIWSGLEAQERGTGVKISELMNKVYKVQVISDLHIDYYPGFTLDLNNLLNGGA